MIWRNVHTPIISELDVMLREARVFSGPLFKMVYGPEVQRYFAPDNSIRLYSIFKEPVVTPYVRSRAEHKTNPRKKDKVLIIQGDEESYGHIVWIDREGDSVGVYCYRSKSMENFALDCLESNSGRTRWRIVE